MNSAAAYLNQTNHQAYPSSPGFRTAMTMVCLFLIGAAGSLSGQTYNVRDFGAAGNGSADDTVAIRQAIAAAAAYANASGQVATIYFPAGTYAVAPQANDTEWKSSEFPFIFEIPTSNLRFFGDGAGDSVISCYTVGLADPNTNWTVLGDGTNYFKIKRGGAFRYPFDHQVGNITFEGLRITGNTPSTPDYAVGGASTRLSAKDGVLRHYAGSKYGDSISPHGYADGTILRFANNLNRPAEIIPQQAYYVINATADTFQIAATIGGTPVKLSDSVDSPDKRFIATNGDGWNMGHTALAMMNGSNGTTTIINCELDRWRGEIVHSACDDSFLIVSNSVFEHSNASSISVPSAVVEDSVFRNVLNGFENYARLSSHRLEIRRCEFVGSETGDFERENAIVFLGLPQSSAVIEDNRLVNWQRGVYLAEVANNVVIQRNDFLDVGTPVAITRLDLYPNDPSGYDNITIDNNDFRLTVGTGGNAIYTQYGNVSNRNFVISNNRLHAGTVSGSWRYLIQDICGASLANRAGFLISGNYLDSFQDADAMGSVRALWMGNIRGTNWEIGSLNDWYVWDEIRPVAIRAFNSDTFRGNNWSSSPVMDVTLDPALRSGKFPTGYIITLSTIASNSWQLVVDPEWNNFTAPVLVTKGNPVTIVVQENGKFGLAGQTIPEPAPTPEPVPPPAPDPEPVAPVSPVLGVGDIGIGSVALTWTIGEAVDSFELEINAAGAGYAAYAGGAVAGTETSLPLAGLGEGVSYSFRLRAVREGLASAWSETGVVTTLVAEPPPPAPEPPPPAPEPTPEPPPPAPEPVAPAAPLLGVSDIGIGSVALGWTIAETVDSFELEINASGAGYVAYAGGAIAGTETALSLIGLGEGVSYSFRLRAAREGLFSAWSETAAVTTLVPEPAPAPEPPPAPVAPATPSLSVADVGVGSVSLSWVLNETVDSFVIHYRKQKGLYLPVTGDVDGTFRSFTVTGLEQGVLYSFRIQAVRSGLTSDWGKTGNVRTLEGSASTAPAAPAAPVLTVGSVAPGTVDLAWSVSETVDSFELQINESATGYVALDSGLFGGSESAVQLTGLVEGASYGFRLRAIRSGLASNWTESNPVEIPFAESGTPDVPADAPVVEAVHFWTFDQIVGMAAADLGLAPLTLDVSAASLGDGIGSSNEGLRFAGTHTGVVVPDADTLNNGVLTELTISVWVKVDAAGSNQTAVIYEQGGYWRGLNLLLSNGVLQANGWNRPKQESEWEGTTLEGGKLIPGEWNHVALVLSGTELVRADGLKLYLNGNLVASGPASQLWKQNDDNGIGQVKQTTVYMGRQIRELAPFQGGIDDLSIWQTALAGSEIQDLILVSAN